MSSHREAPETSKDPVADNTDVYAFISPDRPNTVTLIANFLPLQLPNGGPNFYEFGDDVLYEIHVSNRGDAQADISYQFRFTTEIRNPDTFLYNTGPILSLGSKNWNRPQFYSVTRVTRGGDAHVLASGLAVPPCNVGVRSTPDYDDLFFPDALHRLPGGRRVFAGQRAEAFHVDTGSVFDLGTLRPFQSHHLIPSADAMGINGLQGLNVHSIALQVPTSDLTRRGDVPDADDVLESNSVIGVWASASRPKVRVYDGGPSGRPVGHGPFQQVSRLANPLFNELLVPMAKKDLWNTLPPLADAAFAKYVDHPELAALLPVLYPTTFPHLKSYTKARADLDAILLTGIPKGVVKGFQNYTGATKADMLRLNVAIPPAARPNELGIIGGDLAGFPNGRRVLDDVATIELRAIAGLTIPLVDPSFRPDAAAAGVTDGTHNTNGAYPRTFPYLATPLGGYQYKPGPVSVDQS